MNDFDDLTEFGDDPCLDQNVKQGCTYPKGRWTHLRISEMDLSHLINAEKFARRKGWDVKADEIASEIKKRDVSNTEIVKRAFMLSESQIIEMAKACGFKVPKGGCGVYFSVAGKEFRITEGLLAVKYDRTVRIKKKSCTPISSSKRTRSK